MDLFGAELLAGEILLKHLVVGLCDFFDDSTMEFFGFGHLVFVDFSINTFLAIIDTGFHVDAVDEAIEVALFS